MTEPIQLTLPWPPSVNSMYRAIPRGKHCQNILSRKGREYKESALIAIACHNLPPGELDGDLQVTLDLYPPDARRRDVDNYSKVVLDVLTEGCVWHDDSQIADLHILKRPRDKDNPRVVVTISAITP